MAPRIRVAFDVPQGLRRRLRIAAAQREVTVNEYAREAVSRRVAEDLTDALHADDDPVLAEVWGNEEDDVYDRL